MAYRITFSRYNKKLALREISDAVFFAAPYGVERVHRFRAACEHAEALMRGMQIVDADCEYEIAGVAYEGFSGRRCYSIHGSIWGVPPKEEIEELI